MVNAYNMGMCNGEFIFIALYNFPEAFFEEDDASSIPLWYGGDKYDVITKKAYKYLLRVNLASANVDYFTQFRMNVMNTFLDFNNQSALENLTGSHYSSYLYDAVFIYALLVKKCLTSQLDFRNGSLMLEIARNITFISMFF
uniref:Uncharacterized protein n=1 Tax=Octopus bimaculoides TaxID=37653 RepID=A0A0L8HJH9_OCTBM